MLTALLPLSVIVRVWCPRSMPKCSMPTPTVSAILEAGSIPAADSACSAWRAESGDDQRHAELAASAEPLHPDSRR
jgi:hypothetical protein